MNVKKNAAMKEGSKCKELLFETMDYILDPTSITPSKRTTPRPSYHQDAKTIHVIGGPSYHQDAKLAKTIHVIGGDQGTYVGTYTLM